MALANNPFSPATSTLADRPMSGSLGIDLGEAFGTGLAAAGAVAQLAGSLQRNQSISASIQRNKQIASANIAGLRRQVADTIEDRRQEADRIIGSIRAAAGSGGVTAPIAVTRNVDLARGRADNRARRSLKIEEANVLTRMVMANSQLGQQRMSGLEIGLGAATTAAQLATLG